MTRKVPGVLFFKYKQYTGGPKVLVLWSAPKGVPRPCAQHTELRAQSWRPSDDDPKPLHYTGLRRRNGGQNDNEPKAFYNYYYQNPPASRELDITARGRVYKTINCKGT